TETPLVPFPKGMKPTDLVPPGWNPPPPPNENQASATPENLHDLYDCLAIEDPFNCTVRYGNTPINKIPHQTPNLACSGQQPSSPPPSNENQNSATSGRIMIGQVCNDGMWYAFGEEGRTGEQLADIAEERGITFERASRAAYENRVRRAKEIVRDSALSGLHVEVCTRDGGWFIRVGQLN